MKEKIADLKFFNSLVKKVINKSEELSLLLLSA